MPSNHINNKNKNNSPADVNQTFDGPTFITFKSQPADKPQSSVLQRKKSLKDATNRLKDKQNTVDTLELARKIIDDESKERKNTDMRVMPYNNDGYRYVPNQIEINDLRNINKTNFIKQMIEKQNENVKMEIKNREIEYKNVKLDMDKAIDMIRSTMYQSDNSLKNQLESNNVAQKQFQVIDQEYKALESERNMLESDIRRMETEINTLSSC